MTETGTPLGVLAHELRSPVAALVALAAAAATVTEAPERRRLLALAVAAGRDVERLLGDHAMRSIRPVSLDVGDLVRGLVGDRVVVACADGLRVDGDPTRLRQVLANLVGNGLRHGSRVDVEVRATSDLVLIDVSDDGSGVDPGLDVFALGVSGAGSSGYGLWLARSIAEAHGGTLEVVSGHAPGATFRLALPRASDAA